MNLFTTLFLFGIGMVYSTSYSQTFIPDNNFEAYIENKIPGASNGIPNDNIVNSLPLTNYLGAVNPSSITYPILDFTGIEEFQNAFSINISGMNITNLDFTGLSGTNTRIYVNNCVFLTNIFLSPIPHITIDINNCPSLVNISYPPGLTTTSITVIQVAYCSSITDLDLSNISLGSSPQFTFRYNSLLSSLNLANGQNTLFSSVLIHDNPLLYCVQVDDPIYSDISTNWAWLEYEAWLGGSTVFTGPYAYRNVGDCETLNFENIEIESPSIIKITDILGKESDDLPNKVLFYHYSDGTIKKQYRID
jgi:hypothetical protein